MVYKVMIQADINIDVTVDVEEDALSQALNDFFDTLAFPPSYDQQAYDEDGLEIEDEYETVPIDVQSVSVESIEQA